MSETSLSTVSAIPIANHQAGFGYADQIKALDENFDGFIAKGNNNCIELILDGKVQTAIPVEDKLRKLKFGNENLFYLTDNGQVGSISLSTFEMKSIIHDGNISDFDIFASIGEPTMNLLIAQNNEILMVEASGQVIWRRPVADDKILELVIDPYERSRLLIRTESCLIKVGEITSSKPKIKKLFLSSRLDHFIDKEENSASLRSIIQTDFIRSNRNWVLLLSKRKFLICDISTFDILLVHDLEKSSSSYLSFTAAQYRQIIYFVHESGYISVRATQYSPDAQKFFKPVCVSDKLRSTTWCRCRGITLSKKNETECNLYFTDGKIARFRFEAIESDEQESYLLYGNHVTESKFVARIFGPSDLVETDFENYEKVKFKLRQIAQFGKTIDATFMTLKSNPPLTIKNMEQWQPLAAVGNSKGMLQIVNLAKNEVIGEYLAHTNQIQFIKWIDQKNLITIGESVLHNDQVFSEISKINLDSGRVRIIRKSKSLEAPIENVAPSTTGKYLFIAFRQCQAPELWLIENENKLLRKFPKTDSPLMYKFPTWLSTKSEDKFFFYDSTNSIRFIECQESKLKEVKMIPLKNHSNIISASSFKRPIILTGFQDGSVEILNVKASKSEFQHVANSAIVSMKFGPGKTNQFVLIETRRDFLMWNMQDESIFSKMPKENVLAIDWISSDRMVFLEQADRSLKILNLELNIEVNTNQNTNMDIKKPHISFYEDILSEIEEVKIHEKDNEESSDLENISKIQLLENLQEILLKHNRKSDFILMLLLQSMINKNSSFTGNWLLEGLLSDNERIKCGIKNRIDRLKQITSQVSNPIISEKILRRWAQLSIIFGLTDQTLEYLLSSNGNTFNEDSLRGLLLLMLKDNATNKDLIRNHVKLISAQFLSRNQLLDAVEYLSMTDCLEDAINYLLDQEQFQLAHLLCASHDLEKTQIHSKWTKKLILNGDYDQAAFYNLFFNDINTFVDLSLASGNIIQILLADYFFKFNLDAKTVELVNQKLKALYSEDCVPTKLQLFIQ